jgi:M6 family metalloprotease-like protein
MNMPMPFYGKEFTFSQPDGTPFTVRGWGNQFQAVFETLDGFPVVLNPETRFFEYAGITEDRKRLRPYGLIVGKGEPKVQDFPEQLPLSRALSFELTKKTEQFPSKSQWQVRREKYRTSFREALSFGGPLAKPPERERVGEYVGLCILVEFPDVPGTIAPSAVEAFCNQKGYRGFGNNGSVFDYFYDNSQGKLRYTNAVTKYYQTRHQRAYYTDPGLKSPVKAIELIKEALAGLKEQGFNFQQLSADGNKVYAINVFYAGPCVNNWNWGLWPHQYNLETFFELSPDRLAFDYQITNTGEELSLGTFCHENGHLLCDFPDLYDYEEDGIRSLGVGQYCLMCHGAAKDEKNPANICAYLKYKAGWAEKLTFIPPTSILEANIVAGQNDFFLFRGKTSTEYFIIENRSQTGRDASLPSAGLAIWHVDELGSNENQQMTLTKHYECSLEQADNLYDLEKQKNIGDSTDLYNAQNNPSFGSATKPSSLWWDSQPSGLEISEISKAGQVMTFRSQKGQVAENTTSTQEMTEKLKKLNEEVAIAEAEKKKAEAEKAAALAQKAALETDMERKKLEATGELAIAGAQAEAISKFFPKDLVKPLEGKTEMQDVGSITRLTAYHAMGEIASEIAGVLAKKLKGFKEAVSSAEPTGTIDTPETKNPKVMIVSQLDFAAGDLPAVEIHNQFDQFKKWLKKQIKANGDLLTPAPVVFMVPAMGAVAAPLLTMASMIPGLATLAGYFKTDYKIMGYEFDLDKEGLIVAVAGKLAEKGQEVYRDNFYTIWEMTKLPIIQKFNDLNQLSQELQSSKEQLAAEITKKVSANQDTKELNFALKASQDLLEAYKSYVQSISTKAAGEDSPKLVRAALRDRMRGIGITHLLYLNVAPKSAGEAITKRSLWRNPKYVTYLGGVAVSYVLAERDGRIISGDMVTRLSIYRYRLAEPQQSDVIPTPFWKPKSS